MESEKIRRNLHIFKVCFPSHVRQMES